MSPEPCAVCDTRLPVGSLAHLTIHTKGEEGVVDHYVCRDCYEGALKPLFAPDEPAEDDPTDEEEETTVDGDSTIGEEGTTADGDPGKGDDRQRDTTVEREDTA